MRNEATMTHQSYKSTARHALACKRCERVADLLLNAVNPNERYALMCQIEWHERLATGRRLHS